MTFPEDPNAPQPHDAAYELLRRREMIASRTAHEVATTNRLNEEWLALTPEQMERWAKTGSVDA